MGWDEEIKRQFDAQTAHTAELGVEAKRLNSEISRLTAALATARNDALDEALGAVVRAQWQRNSVLAAIRALKEEKP